MQSKAIHVALKQIIRSKGKTYADAAGVLNLSEPSEIPIVLCGVCMSALGR